MARGKKLKGSGKGAVSKKQSEGSRGERLRKREEEREVKRAAKRRKLGKKPLITDRSGGHEGRVKKHANKRRLELARLKRLVSKQEKLLHDYRPTVIVAPLDPELKRKRRRRDFYDLDTSHWRLKGAARPADSLPGAGGTELVNERDDWEAGVDLFEKLPGKEGEGGFYEGPAECREYLDLNHRLAQALQHDTNESKVEEALARYQRCLELDPADHVMARRGLVRLLLDAGDADKARAVIDRFPDDRGCEMAWSLAAIEFVAWSVLEEEGAGEEVAAGAFDVAYRANPFVAWNIAHRDIFDEVVEHADEIVNPPAGSIEEAFWYMIREGGLWASLEGCSEWISELLLGNETLPPDPRAPNNGAEATEGAAGGDGGMGTERGRDGRVDRDATATSRTGRVVVAPLATTDNAEMFAGMFNTAVGMAAEMAAQQIGLEGEEGEREGADDEEHVREGMMEEDDAVASILSGNENAGEGAAQGGASSGDDSEDHSNAES